MSDAAMSPAPRPFSGPRYAENSERCAEKGDGHEPCALCGKAVKAANWRWTVRVVDGGGSWAAKDAVADEAGEMGCHPVGADCAKVLRAAGVPVWKEPMA